MIAVELDYREVGLGLWVAQQRFMSARANGSHHNGGNAAQAALGDFRIDQDTNGSCAEYAFCKPFPGLTWRPTWDVPKEWPDIEPDWQVRVTEHVERGHLRFKRDDPPDHRYVLLLGRPPRYLIAGWIWGYDAADHPVNAAYGCHWVPQSALTPFEGGRLP